MKLPVRSTLPFQIPEFVAEEKPLFVDFLDAYYEFLEQEGYSVDYVRNALTFLDVDRTLDNFVNYFWEEVKDIPLDAKADRRLLAKHIYDLYQSKGTIKSFKLLFRILYNEEIEIYTPKIDMLRISDGKWSVDYVVRSTAVSGDPFGLTGLSLHQKNPDASLLVQNVIKKSYGTQDFYDIQVEPLSVVGTFRYNETAFANWTDVDGNQQTITVFLPPEAAHAEIRTAGSYYEAGEVISLYDTTGADFLARISNVGLGRIDDVLILDGGSGYSVGDSLLVDNTNTGGTGLKVTVLAVDAGVITKLNVVNPGIGYSELPIVTGAHGGKFLPVSTTIGRITEVSIADLGHDHPVQTTESNLRTRGVITDPVGTFVAGESITILEECLLTENYFSLLAEDGTRILNEQQIDQTTAATVFKVIDNYIQVDGQISRRAIEEEDLSGVILTEDGGAIINELSSADLNRRTIQGATSTAVCRVLDIHPAGIVFDVGTLGETSRQFASPDGMVSEVSKRIQDSKFYQDFSYVIKSSQSIDTYKNIVQRLIHPAGMAMFGEVSSSTLVQIGLRLIDQINNIINLETFIAMDFVPALGSTHLTQQAIFQSEGSSFAYFDKWKFDNYALTADSPYQSDTLISNFSDFTFETIYTYDNDGNVVDYAPTHTYLNRGCELRVNGTLV